jgi:hypothetical protein
VNEQVIIKNVKSYREDLAREGFTAKKFDENAYATSASPADLKRHAVWICEQVIHLIEDNQRELAIMWYGFLQAMMWLEDDRTIEELRQHNVPGATG